MKRNSTSEPVLCALFAALTAVCAQFSVPIGPVPISLATFAVYLAGGILGASGGAVEPGRFTFCSARRVCRFSPDFAAALGDCSGQPAAIWWDMSSARGSSASLSRRFGRKTLPLVCFHGFGDGGSLFSGHGLVSVSDKAGPLGISYALRFPVSPRRCGKNCRLRRRLRRASAEFSTTFAQRSRLGVKSASLPGYGGFVKNIFHNQRLFCEKLGEAGLSPPRTEPRRLHGVQVFRGKGYRCDFSVRMQLLKQQNFCGHSAAFSAKIDDPSAKLWRG